jgi:hypothetical protein
LDLSRLSRNNGLPAHFFPAAVGDGDSLLRPHHDLKRFLDLELKTPKLDRLLDHLWLAGPPRCARPLHRQRLIGRTILITENPHEHLIWFESHIFIKPHPDFLLNFEFWQDQVCSDIELHKAACGFVLSYVWLVRHQSDLRIAKEVGLIHKKVEWSQWALFLENFLSHINPETFEHVSDRYHFGELRLTRLNVLHRLTGRSCQFIHGYMSHSTWYKAFFSRNFAWLLAIFAYVTVILSALQVGLSTSVLQGNTTFQNVSHGVGVMSIMVVICSVVMIFLVWLVLFCYYIRSTILYHRSAMLKRGKTTRSDMKC